MRSPRPLVPAALLVMAMVVVPLAGVALADALRPVIPAEPAIPADPAAAIPALPAPPTTVRPLATWFERLPIVDPGSDTTPRPFVAQYRSIPAGDSVAAARLIDVAFREIRVVASAETAARQLLDALTLPAEPPPDEGDPALEPDPDATDAPQVDQFETPEFRTLSLRAMTAIAATPANARALNDLAVAIATTSLADPSILPSGDVPGAPTASSAQLREAAIRLLELGRASFPGDRSMAINVAYLESLTATLGSPSETGVEPPDTWIAALQAYVDGAPTDVVARSLLASVVGRADPQGGLDRATAIAKPLIDDPEHEAAGRIIRADSALLAAEQQRVRAPFAAAALVRQALDDYDHAIELSGDAAAYAGRALALDLLRSRDAAAEAQREAVRLAPSSVSWRLRLARLDGCAGQVEAWRRDAQEAFRTAVEAKRAPAIGTRYIVADAPGPGYDEFSVGSDLPTWDVTIRAPATGTEISAISPFPEPEACITVGPATATTVDDAAVEAVLAPIAAEDLADARTAVEAWRKLQPPSEDDVGSDPAMPSAMATVLDLLSGAKPLADDPSIEMVASVASRLPPDVEGRFCTMLSGITGLERIQVDALIECTAEAADRAGDHAAAARALDPAVRLDDATNPIDGLTALRAGMLSELTGQLDVARERYEAAATHSETSIAGLIRLGDLALKANDATGALDHYALAEAAIRTQTTGSDEGVILDTGPAERSRQYLDNNRGIALLITARTDPDTPPDCGSHAATCREAGDAFAAAMAADPLNPVYPMNAAWVARLSGDPDRATTLLARALEEGTPLVAPAYNDLGALAAQRGDLANARQYFRQAIATEPGYDLATWNLGVLESGTSGTLLLGGQALMADATRANASLRTKPLAFQTDERVYRVEVSGNRLELVRAPGTGAAAGAAVFGVIATIGALVRFFSGLGQLDDVAITLTQEGLARGRRRTIFGRSMPVFGSADDAPPSRPWLAWIPALIVLVVTTAWTASWMAPDAFLTALAIGLVMAALALVVHTCGHLVVARPFEAAVGPAGWGPGIVLALIGMPFHVPAGPFLAERISARDVGASWWASFAGVLANLAAAAVSIALYLVAPMPFLRVLIATQLAVAAFSLIPSDPLDGDRLATHPVILALTSLAIAAASTAIAVGVI